VCVVPRCCDLDFHRGGSFDEAKSSLFQRVVLVQAATSCDCYCSTTLPTAVPFPFAGTYTANSCSECSVAECRSRFSAQCLSSCPTCGQEARCGDLSSRCSSTALPGAPALSVGWQFSSTLPYLEHPMGSVALLQCSAGTDGRLAQSAFGSLFQAVCDLYGWNTQQWKPACDGA
jgi:hypothetical protein